jgi:uncharacterized protein (UPF0333 family)
MRKKISNEEGFSSLEAIILLIIVLLIGLVGWWVYHINHNQGGAGIVTGPVTSKSDTNEITIMSPANNSTVSREFNIIGTATPPNNEENENISLVIDNDKTWTYANLTNNQLDVASNGSFSLPLNFNGNKVLEQKTAVAGGYSYTYKGLPPGKHKLTIDEISSGKINSLVEIKQGPTITLNIE